MLKIAVALAVSIVSWWSTPSYSHGLDRDFGASINEQTTQGRSADSGGAAEFTLLALKATLRQLEWDARDGNVSEAHEATRSMRRMADELIARSQSRGDLVSEQAGLAATAIAAHADLIDSAAMGGAAEIILSEVVSLREAIAPFDRTLRSASD